MKLLKENYYFIILLAVCVLFASYQLDRLAEEDAYMEIVIHEGDTLWQLASDYSEGTPAHEWIKQVKNMNNLPTDQIKSGELLRLPVKIERNDQRFAKAGEEAS